MFGGYGIYADGVIFAIIASDELYFKVDDSNRAQFAQRDGRQFAFAKKDGTIAKMCYWTLPESVASDRALLDKWVAQSVAISQHKGKK